MLTEQWFGILFRNGRKRHIGIPFVEVSISLLPLPAELFNVFGSQERPGFFLVPKFPDGLWGPPKFLFTEYWRLSLLGKAAAA
jgi:hypothetical protein